MPLLFTGVAMTLGLTAGPAGAAGPPQIGATWATDVTATSATVQAEVNPEGSNAGYRFEYLTEAAFISAGESFAGAETAPPFGEEGLGSGETAQPALQSLVSLAPATTYRYRILVTSTAAPGGVTGATRSFTTQPNATGGPENCSNSQLRIENNSLALPDCRAWEMVSPVDKNGGAVQDFGANAGGDVLQAAQGGGAATYSSASSFGTAPAGAAVASQYIARRKAGGWSTENITQPTLSGAYGFANTGVPYQLFSPDLGRGLLLDGRRCGAGEGCLRSYSLRQSAGGVPVASPATEDLHFAGANANLDPVILSTCAALTPDATEVPDGSGGCIAAETNLYAWSGGAPQLINLLPGQLTGTPGARLAAQSAAVSGDGSRVYFTELENGALYLREAGGTTKLVPESAGGGASFQTASADGSVAFFTVGGTLYRFDAQAQDSQPLATGVQGVLGASADGTYLYYASAAGLFLWHAGTTSEIAPGPGAAAPSDYPPTTGTARVSPDGRHLAFLSEASLTGYDNIDQGSGEPASEVYLYTASDGGGAGALLCISCNPTNARPLGPSTIPGAIANGEGEAATDLYKPHNLTTDGSRLFFDSRDALTLNDTSAAQDVYEWEASGKGSCRRDGGCLTLISSGASPQASAFIDASADGSDSFLLTVDSLIPTDPGSFDLYDARTEGGFPLPPSPTPCNGDACQAVSAPPPDPTPGTLVRARPNPPVHFPSQRCRSGQRRVVRHGKARCVTKHNRNRSQTHRRGGSR